MEPRFLQILQSIHSPNVLALLMADKTHIGTQKLNYYVLPALISL